MNSNIFTVAALDKGTNFIKGFLSCNYNLFDSNNKLMNVLYRTLQIYIFGIRVFIHG